MQGIQIAMDQERKRAQLPAISGKTGREPSCPDVGVIFVVPDCWESLAQPRHQVAVRLAKYFRVLWLDGIRTETGKRLDRDNPAGTRPDLPPDDLVVQRVGRVSEFLHRRLQLDRTVLRYRVERARRTLERMGCRTVCVYVWRPAFANVLDCGGIDRYIYHVDDEYTFSESEQPVPRSEEELLRRSDCVFVHSTGLLEKKGNYNANTIFVPNGVDSAAYETVTVAPSDIVSLPRPVIGYVGVIKSQLDFGLLVALATARPDWSFVLVGPVGYLGAKVEEFERLRRLPNVILPGRKRLAELPGYTQAFDVCMMCYEVTDYTNHIYPLKLHEYLAAGAPVVSSPIRTVVDFDALVGIADGVKSWEATIEKLLSDEFRAPAFRERCRAAARTHDWERIVARIALEIGTIVSPAHAARCQGVADEAGHPGLFDAGDCPNYSERVLG